MPSSVNSSSETGPQEAGREQHNPLSPRKGGDIGPEPGQPGGPPSGIHRDKDDTNCRSTDRKTRQPK